MFAAVVWVKQSLALLLEPCGPMYQWAGNDPFQPLQGARHKT